MSYRESEQDLIRQNHINEAVQKLENVTNSSLYKHDWIAKPFSRMHSYLLNQIALGVMKAVNTRYGDGRIDLRLQKCAKEIWGE